MGSYVPPTSLLSSIFLPNPLKDVKKEVHGNTDSNSRSLQASTNDRQMKEAADKNALFSLSVTPMSFPPPPWFI